MKEKWKQAVSLLALSVMAMGTISINSSSAAARNKSSKMEPPPAERVKSDTVTTEPTAVEYGVDGQILEKPARVGVTAKGTSATTPIGNNAPPATEKNQLCGLPHTPPCRVDAPSTDWETGQLLIKDKPVIKAARVKAGGGTSGWVIPVAGALAVGAGVLAVTSGDNNPASPN